jgi:hypothetical protein
LKNAFTTSFQGRAETKRCIVIPIDDNSLYIGEKGVYLDMVATELRDAKFDDTHLVKRSIPKDVYAAMTEEERKNNPIIGNLKPISKQQHQLPPNDGALTPAVANDDLPF